MYLPILYYNMILYIFFQACYDLDQALVMCQMNNFKAGILYLYEKARLYQQILR